MSEPQKGEVYRKGSTLVKVQFTTDHFVIVSGCDKPEEEASIGKAIWQMMGWERVEETEKGLIP